MAEQDLVLVAIESGIARITLNRPDRLNALDQDLAMALATTLEGLERDPGLRAVTLRYSRKPATTRRTSSAA